MVHTTPAGVPLGANADPRTFKATLVDLGLMQHLHGVPPQWSDETTDLLAMHDGAVAEQFVGQETLASQGELFYWAREAKSSTAEVDYLAVAGGHVVPVEVKRGAAGRLRSLHRALESYPNCPYGMVLSSRPWSELPAQKLRFVPLYHAGSATRP